MSILQNPVTLKSFEVEYSMAEVHERVLGFLVSKANPLLLSLAYWRALGVRKLLIEEGKARLRGLATRGYDHTVMLRLNQSTRWMEDGAYSQLNGQEDLSPSGILAHEMGHHFQWAYEGCVPGREALRTFMELPLSGFFTDYGRTAPVEAFAETYRLWITNPILLGQLDHVRFELMERMVEEFDHVSGFNHKKATRVASLWDGYEKRQRLETLLKGIES